MRLGKIEKRICELDEKINQMPKRVKRETEGYSVNALQAEKMVDAKTRPLKEERALLERERQFKIERRNHWIPKTIWSVIVPFVTAVIASLIVMNLNTYSVEWFQKRCDFKFEDVREYTGQYGFGDHFFVYEGLIKNKSETADKLKGVVAKIYNEKGIFLAEGYQTIGVDVGPEKAVPFKVTVVVPTLHETEKREYFEMSSSFEPDIYPWFSSCK